MRYSELFELFDSEAPLEWVQSGSHVYAHFKLGDRNFTIKFEVLDQEPNCYFVQFEDLEGGWGMTGGGEGATVIGIVLNAMKQFVAEHNPDAFMFTADAREPSRVSLYTRMCQKLARTVPYKCQIKVGRRDTRYKFTRRDLVETVVTEMFDSEASLKWTEFGNDTHAFFNVGGNAFKIDFTYISKGVWFVMFEDILKGAGITGGGNAAAVFSVVLSALKQFVAEKMPDEVYFTAATDEPSRVSLYKRMCSKLASGIDYTLTISANQKNTKFKFVRRVQ